MPVVQKSEFNPPKWLRNSHLQTCIPSLFRKVHFAYKQRETLHTPDKDFFDLDSSLYSSKKQDTGVLILHGLESSSDSNYIRAMASNLYFEGFNIHCMNFRGCSGKTNKLARSYHSGDTDDLKLCIDHLLNKYEYNSIVLIGFSLGGNVLLKYLGETGYTDKISCAVAISVPCDLESSAHKLALGSNRIYMRRFMKKLLSKIEVKSETHAEIARQMIEFKQMKTFIEFDEHYTAKYHGFQSALHYWRSSSCKPLIPYIKIPTYLINALDDPFFTTQCFPLTEAQNNPKFYLEIPEYGGHVGFFEHFTKNPYWHEKQTIQFIREFSKRCNDIIY